MILIQARIVSDFNTVLKPQVLSGLQQHILNLLECADVCFSLIIDVNYKHIHNHLNMLDEERDTSPEEPSERPERVPAPALRKRRVLARMRMADWLSKSDLKHPVL
ncbi:hypothetical protein HY463_00245 [Candidatus Peregrinibacteria bacterium]|nr:hypothetical protein [Candidatus Peregrinibacteria bacterium]